MKPVLCGPVDGFQIPDSKRYKCGLIYKAAKTDQLFSCSNSDDHVYCTYNLPHTPCKTVHNIMSEVTETKTRTISNPTIIKVLKSEIAITIAMVMETKTAPGPSLKTTSTSFEFVLRKAICGPKCAMCEKSCFKWLDSRRYKKKEIEI